MKAIVLLFAMSTAMLAQNAKVIELTPAEASEAKAIAAGQKDFELREQDLRYDIGLHHKIAIEMPTRASACIGKGCTPPELPKPVRRWVEFNAPGWFSGFDYSEDYRFIVPKMVPASNGIQYNLSGCGTNAITNCIQPTPYVGAVPLTGDFLAH